MIDIEKLASEAGMNTSMWKYGAGSMVFTLGIEGVARGAIERFAALVRNEVLEEAVEALRKEYMTGTKPTFLYDLEAAIRALKETT
jgi:hypothetical protein